MSRMRAQSRVAATLAALGGMLLPLLGTGPASAISLIPGENVRTEYGVVQGNVRPDHREFRSVPFAAAPTGQRRFAPPQAPAPWKGERWAKQAAPACAQAWPILGTLFPSSEDCLYADVFTPPTARGTNLPVMVWLHGGSYVLGYTDQYDPTPLVTRGDVIVVHIAYRMGPFGFLTVPGGETNLGLQDQQFGLQWVRRNIAAFGGDPQNVTLFGESAGGNGVCQQLVSPASRGLFQRAIVQSGGCGGPTLDARPRAEADATGVAYAATLGCRDVATITACLRTKSKDAMLADPSTRHDSMNLVWRPVIDGRVVTALSDVPLNRGDFARVPVMIGGMHDEARFFVAVFLHALTQKRVSPAEYERQLRLTFGDRAGEVLAAYPISRYGNADLALSTAWTDGLLSCYASANTKALVRGGAPAVYAYEFAEPNPPVTLPDPFMKLGSYHGSDLLYLFSKAFGVPVVYRDPVQNRLSQQMIGYWSTFARTGDPNGGGRPVWPQASSGSLLTLKGTGPAPSTLAAFDADHRCAFWS